MNNLIIATIAIGLAATLSLSTIYYGGSAYQNSQARAKALKVIAVSQQIAAAWKLYANNRGDNYAIAASANGLNTSLVSKYLPMAVALPDIAALNSGYPLPVKQTASATTNNPVDSNALQFYGLDDTVCAQINQAVANTTQIVSAPAASVIYSRAAAGFCYLSGGANYYILRVFP